MFKSVSRDKLEVYMKKVPATVNLVNCSSEYPLTVSKLRNWEMLRMKNLTSGIWRRYHKKNWSYPAYHLRWPWDSTYKPSYSKYWVNSECLSPNCQLEIPLDLVCYTRALSQLYGRDRRISNSYNLTQAVESAVALFSQLLGIPWPAAACKPALRSGQCDVPFRCRECTGTDAMAGFCRPLKNWSRAPSRCKFLRVPSYQLKWRLQQKLLDSMAPKRHTTNRL